MRGLVYHGEKDLRYETDIPDVKISNPHEILVDVYYCGICGTDLKEYSSSPNFFDKDGGPNKLTGLKPPLCMGHEIAGIVIEVGPQVTSVKVGDQVVIDPSVHCADKIRFPTSPHIHDPKYKCIQCRKNLTNICDHLSLCGLGAQHGGLAEKFVTSEYHAVIVPKRIPIEIAALTQPLAVSYHAVRISHFQPGSSALVIGGGAIGLAAILCCFGFRASSVVCSEPSKVRRDNAELLGAKGFDPFASENAEEDLLKLSPHGHGFDYTFDCSGFESTLHTAIHTAASNGTIVNIAIWGKKPINFWPMDVTKHEKRLMGSMCYTREDFEGVLACFDRGDMDIETTRKLITTVVGLDNGIKGGFDHLMNHKDTEIKVLITPNNHGELEQFKGLNKAENHI